MMFSIAHDFRSDRRQSSEEQYSDPLLRTFLSQSTVQTDGDKPCELVLNEDERAKIA